MNKCGFKPLESQAFWGSQVASGMLKAYGFGLTLQPRNVVPKLLATAPLVRVTLHFTGNMDILY